MPVRDCGNACWWEWLLVADQVEIPPILLVRLKSHGPDGVLVGERQRVCHLVPVPHVDGVPEVLRAYCGEEILPGAAELLGGVSGMPCNQCLSCSRIPAFAMLRRIHSDPARIAATAEQERGLESLAERLGFDITGASTPCPWWVWDGSDQE